MIVKIIDFKTNEEILEPLSEKKNATAKKIMEDMRLKLNEKYGCEITRFVITGGLNFATLENDLHFIPFGKDLDKLPTREIIYIKEQENG